MKRSQPCCEPETAPVRGRSGRAYACGTVGPLALALVLAWGLAGCRPQDPAPPRNVLLISIDTLRADHLGCYGYGRPTSPEIDAFCEQSAVFEHTVAHAPSTLLSHTSLLTSRLPQHHGTSHIRNLPLADEVPTLATVLGRAGFATASFNSGGQLAAEFGLDQGFEVYESGEHAFRWAVDRGLAWLDRRSGSPRSEAGIPAEKSREAAEPPFFLFLHSYEVHLPYTPEPRFSELFDDGYEGPLPDHISIELVQQINRGQVEIDDADLDHVRAVYDAGIRSMDESFGRLLAGLAQRGLLESTLVVLTSDHGEEFAEHGMVAWHSHTLYEELLRVPLVMRVPGRTDRRPVRLPFRVRSIDMAPTVLELLGQPPQPSFHGRSLVPWLGSEPPNEPPPSESIAFWDTPRRVYESIAARRYKYYDGQLYDLEADPGEQHDLAERHPELVERMERRLAARVAAERAVQGEAIELDAETEKQLRALGYID